MLRTQLAKEDRMPTKIVIWGVYRSGTTFLYDVVFNHIYGIENNKNADTGRHAWNLYDIMCEPYHADVQYYSKQPMATHNIHDMSCDTVVKNLSLQIDLIPEDVMTTLSESFVQIGIFRRNWIDLLISSAKARASVHWTTRTFDATCPSDHAVEIDIEWMIRSLTWLTRQLTSLLEAVEFDQIVWYEDIADDTSVNIHSLGTVSLTQCTTVRLPEKRTTVSNYDAARAALIRHFQANPIITEYYTITGDGHFALTDNIKLGNK